MIRVLVSGAAGKMGSEVVRAVAEAYDMEVVAAVDPGISGCLVPTASGEHVECRADLAMAIEAARPDVMVDFTHPTVVEGNLRVALAAGVDCVVGTTGLSEDKLAELAKLAPEGTTLFFAPNFAIGAVLLMRFAELASPFFETAEIIELHHDAKADAPSGTAMMTALRMAAASSQWAADPTRHEVLPGARGGVGAGGIHIHSVRLRGLVAHQEVLLGTAGQTLTLRHDSYDRASFMPGVLLAVKRVAERPGLTVGLDALLGI